MIPLLKGRIPRNPPRREPRDRPVQRCCRFWGAAAPLNANPPGIAPHTSGSPRIRGAGVPTKGTRPSQGTVTSARRLLLTCRSTSTTRPIMLSSSTSSASSAAFFPFSAALGRWERDREVLSPQLSASRPSCSEFLGRRQPGKAGAEPRPAPSSSRARGTGKGHLSPRCRRVEDVLSPGRGGGWGGG